MESWQHNIYSIKNKNVDLFLIKGQTINLENFKSLNWKIEVDVFGTLKTSFGDSIDGFYNSTFLNSCIADYFE